jgi:hypothetical protein
MMPPEREPDDFGPITGALLDQGVAQLEPGVAGVARVLAGLELFERDRLAGGPSGHGEFQRWRVGRDVRHALHDLAFVAESGPFGWLRVPAMADQEARPRMARPPLLRLVVEGNVVATEVVPRLLACPGVASAVVPAERIAGALKSMEWQWPLRLGVYDAHLRAEVQDRRRRAGVLPEGLISVSDSEHRPEAVGLLVTTGDPRELEAALSRNPRVASAVLLLGATEERWAVTATRLGVIRAITGASVTALAAPTKDTALALLKVLRELSHGHPLDVALTAAFDRQVLVVGEPAAMEASALPSVIYREAQAFRRDLQMGFRQPMAPDAFDAVHRLEDLSEGGFDFERYEASAAVDVAEQLQAEIAATTVERVLQSYVAPAGFPGMPDNRLVPGANELRVFVGPEEVGALAGMAVPDDVLGFEDPSVRSARVTVALIPVDPPGEPITTLLDVPRVGRSRDAVLSLPLLEAPDARFEGRLVLLHRNRVLQTCVLTGRVGGDPVDLTERLVFWDRFGDLDDRQAFDHAFVLNHDDSGCEGIHSFANGRCETIGSTPEVETISSRIRNFLIEGASARGRAEQTRIYIHLARQGSNLHRELSGYFAALKSPERLQVVTARPTWFLPIEFIYDRRAPVDGARLCDNWVAGKVCGAHCFASDTDQSVVCPSVFWGMRKVVERQYVKADSRTGTVFHVGGANPSASGDRLDVTSAALAASKLVKAKDLKGVLSALGGVTAAGDWPAWVASLAARPTGLLTLMPHTDDEQDTMEIAGSLLDGALIEPPYVTGERADAHPVVVLLGCDTAGFERNPSGFASRFLQSQAAVVFATMTMLSTSQAPQLCVKLAGLLRDEGREAQTLGEFVATFRREAVRDGVLAALSVTALGNADWRI